MIIRAIVQYNRHAGIALMLLRKRMPELVIPIEQTEQGEFVARASDGSIFAQAESFAGLKGEVVQLISSRVPNGAGPIRVRLQLDKVRTSSFVGYLATTFAWELEIGVILIHLFGKEKIPIGAHAVLLVATLSLTSFAWHRRQDFRDLRGSIGRMPLTAGQMWLVVAFVMGMSVGIVAIGIGIFGL